MSNENEKSSSEEKKYNESFFVNLAFVILAFALLITIVLIPAKNGFKKYFDFTELAALGDFLGGMITAFLTISTVLLVYATYKTQQKELAATRLQLEETVKQAEITNETMKLQQFENTFFNMINMHSNLMNDLKFFGEDVKGRETIVKFYNDINSYFYVEELELFLDNMIYDEEGLVELHHSICDFHGGNYEYIEFTNFRNAIGMIEDDWGTENQYIKLCGLEKFKPIHLKRMVDRKPSNQFAKKLRDEFLYNKEKQYKAFSYIDSQKYYPFSNYKKSIKTIIRFVDDSKFTKEIKEKYLDIFFSQFTIHEITVLKYIIELDNEDELKGYFDKYSNLNIKDTLIDSIV